MFFLSLFHLKDRHSVDLDLGVVHKWRHAILEFFDTPSPIVTLFITEALLVLLSQNPWPPPSVMSFTDDPLYRRTNTDESILIHFLAFF